jgi:hypothetical protein
VLGTGREHGEDRDPVHVRLDLDAQKDADLAACGDEARLDHPARFTSTGGSPGEASIRARAGELDLDPS